MYINLVTNLTGFVGIKPRQVFLETSADIDTLTSQGFLDKTSKLQGPIFESDIIFTSYDSGSSNGIFKASITNGVITLSQAYSNIEFPVTANHMAVFKNTSGTIGDDAATAINEGNIQAGTSGAPGSFISVAPTAAKGTLRLTAEDNTGDTDTIISNDEMGQETTVFIPDPGAATANFLLDDGAANIIAFQQFVGLKDVAITGAGAANWTLTRVAQSNYAYVHTVGADASILAVDLTPYIRTAASKGFRLDSVDVIYFIGAAAVPITNSVTIDRVNYVNNAAVAVTSVALTGTLPFAAQANPYVANLAITTPAFDNVANSKYVLEYTVSTDTTTIFSFYGFNLHFSQTIA